MVYASLGMIFVCSMLTAQPLPGLVQEKSGYFLQGKVPSGMGSLQSHAGDIFFSGEYLLQAMVQEELRLLSTPTGKSWLSEGLRRSEPYRAFIIDILEQHAMPKDLLWIVMLESVFKIDAVSKSGASGFWQFMKNSVGTAMTIDEWQDQRFDFWRSTIAATEKLKYNFEQCGDWLLAIAAYNSGLGAIQRLVKLYPNEDYWTLAAQKRFSGETQRYVPRYLAISYMCNHPVRNGLLYSWNKPVQWARIGPVGAMQLQRMAEEAAIPEKLLLDANREFKHKVIPANKSGNWIKVPIEYISTMLDVIENNINMDEITIYGLQQGDTISAIARKHGSNVKSILQFNPSLDLQDLQPGTPIMIPRSVE